MQDFNIQFIFDALGDVVDAFISAFTMLTDAIDSVITFITANAGVVEFIQLGFNAIPAIIINVFIFSVLFIFIFVVIRKGLTQMFLDIMEMIFDVIGTLFATVFGFNLGGITYGGVFIVITVVFGIISVVLDQFLDRPADFNKPVKNMAKRGKKPMPTYDDSHKHVPSRSVDRAALIKSIRGE